MNKTELIAEVANKAGLSRKDAEKALGAVVETITEAVVKGDKVQLVALAPLRRSSARRARAATPRRRRPSRSRQRVFLCSRPVRL